MRHSLELTVVSITNFIVVIAYAIAAFRLLCRSRCLTSAWWWAISGTLIAASSLVAGVNHGYFQFRIPEVSLILYFITAILIGLTATGIYFTVFLHFLARSHIRTTLNILAVLVLIVYTGFILLDKSLINTENQLAYWPMIIDYCIPLLLFFIFNLCFIRSKGSVHFIMFFLFIIVGSVIQQLPIQALNGLISSDMLYHIMGAFSAIFFFCTGKALLKKSQIDRHNLSTNHSTKDAC